MTEQAHNTLQKIYDELKSNEDPDVRNWLTSAKILKDLEFLLAKEVSVITPRAEYGFTPNK